MRAAKPSVIVVVGAPGAPEYASAIWRVGEQWQEAAKKAAADFQLIGQDEAAKPNDRELLQKLLADSASDDSAPLWLVFIGHGTFDGQTAKFNLRGPDVSAEELATWLAPVKRPIAVIQCASASAPVHQSVGRRGSRGHYGHQERRRTELCSLRPVHFGDDRRLRADLDKDGQVSLLEAYLTACRQVDEFYSQEARLATEHALLGRQRRRPRHAGRLVSRLAGNAAGQGRRNARRHAGPPVSPRCQRPRAAAAGRCASPPRRAGAKNRRASRRKRAN